MKRRRVSRPSRKVLIAALGLQPETRRRGDSYAASTDELWNCVKSGNRDRDKQARKNLGL